MITMNQIDNSIAFIVTDTMLEVEIAATAS